MYDISTEMMTAIEWGIVPLILIGILAYFLIYIPGKNASKKIKNSSSSGKFAGFIIFALFVLTQKNRELSFSFKMPAYDFNYLIVSISIVAGFVFSWFFSLIKKKKIIGLYTLVLVGSTTTTIYSYLFIHDLRSYIVFITMGIILGILVHAIFFPKEATLEDKIS
ncbi:MAG: hypothetical protein KAR45_04820 [Desulfobacteraceae bacterium]|nr:hypothetical protein [Desulfobacteraceae bacterium]